MIIKPIECNFNEGEFRAAIYSYKRTHESTPYLFMSDKTKEALIRMTCESTGLLRLKGVSNSMKEDVIKYYLGIGSIYINNNMKFGEIEIR